MKDNIKLLEQRVHRTVDRLKELTAERKRLQSEMETLQGQLERLEAETAAEGPDDGDRLAAQALIVAELKAVVTDLRET